MTVEPWPLLPRTDARRTLSSPVQPMLTPDNRVCLVHGLIWEPGYSRQRLRITILTPKGKIAAMASMEDLRPIPGTKPFLVPNARNPILTFDVEPAPAPPSRPQDGYAVFAGADSIIPRPNSGTGRLRRIQAEMDADGVPLIPGFLRNHGPAFEATKLRPYPPVLVTVMLAVLDGIGRILDQIDMARLAAGVRANAAHLDRRQEKHLKAWEDLAAARAAIPPIQN